MSYRILMIAVALAFAATGVSEAASKHRRNHQAVYAPPYAHVPAPFYSGGPQPPYMVRVTPGYVISSYDCVTDEGGGRIYPCSAGGRSR